MSPDSFDEYYRRLGIMKGASSEAIHTAYIRVRAECHARHDLDEQSRAAELQAIEAAYQALHPAALAIAAQMVPATQLAEQKYLSSVLRDAFGQPAAQATRVCPTCGRPNPGLATICGACGQQISQPCPKCGANVSLGSMGNTRMSACSRCGTPLNEFNATLSSRARAMEAVTTEDRHQSVLQSIKNDAAYQVRWTAEKKFRTVLVLAMIVLVICGVVLTILFK